MSLPKDLPQPTPSNTAESFKPTDRCPVRSSCIMMSGCLHAEIINNELTNALRDGVGALTDGRQLNSMCDHPDEVKAIEEARRFLIEQVIEQVKINNAIKAS